MGSLTCAEMRQLEERAFKQGVTAEALMEKAGRGIAHAILRRFPQPGTVLACIGTGNNGGDALVAARYLADAGWQVGVRYSHKGSELGVLPRKKLRELGDCPVNAALPDFDPGRPLVLLDGLLGIGANGPLRSPLAELAAWMNCTRASHPAQTIAMDIPSGVHGDSGEVYDGAVVADLTLTVGVPKRGLLASAAVNHTGAMERVALDELPVPDNGSPCLGDIHSVHGLLPRRAHDTHKGNAGRVGILAGSRGMLGAAVLCATGALRGGAGLVTVFVDHVLYPALASMLPPEAMLRPVSTLAEIDPSAFDAMALGPGLGQEQCEDFLALIKRIKVPLVIDADGLNRIAKAGPGGYIGENSVLTPHPGELARLHPGSKEKDRLDVAREFVDQYPGATLLLKGARTIIARAGLPIYVNGSGNAGMASGGQGDMLTGVIASLLAQGVRTHDAARYGAWLCGRAAELAISHGMASEPSLLAGDIGCWLGRAYRESGVC